MKKLNFYPDFQRAIFNRTKICSIRLGRKYSRLFAVGDKIELTVGYIPEQAPTVATVTITNVYIKFFYQLTPEELKCAGLPSNSGEARKKLEEIYMRKIPFNKTVTVIWWRYK